jgi:predicted RNA-binding protein YlxR (DUF448 family)
VQAVAEATQDEQEADTGPRDREVERLCVATRTVRPVSELLRFVVDPTGGVVPDIKRRLPGRGVWVTASRAAVEMAVKRSAFARGFKAQVQVRPDLVQLTDELLEQAALDALSIAHKAGLVALGFTRVEQALEQGRVVALLHAADAAPDGVRKLAAAAKRGEAEGTALGVPVTEFSREQLDLAIGRPNVIHAALLAGPASESFIARYRGLTDFRAAGPAKRAEKECD